MAEIEKKLSRLESGLARDFTQPDARFNPLNLDLDCESLLFNGRLYIVRSPRAPPTEGSSHDSLFRFTDRNHTQFG